MAAEHEDHEDQAPEHGAPPAGGKHKGGKLAQLFTGPHRDAILVVCSVVMVLLMWLTLRRTSNSAASSGGAMTSQLGPTQAAQTGLSSGSVAGSDASALLGFQTLLANQSDQIQQINQAVQGITASGTPDQTPSALSSPIAAGLLGPSSSSRLVKFGNGLIAQVQDDGSLLGLNRSEYVNLTGQLGAGGYTVDNLGGTPPAGISSVRNNLAHAANNAHNYPGKAS